MKQHRVPRIIGIDPGSTRAGYGVIDFCSHPTLVEAGILYTDSSDKNEVLAQLYTSLNDVIKRTAPTLSGIEKLYFAKNVKTAIEVSQSRGVLVLSLAQHHIPLLEFTPLEIKQGLTGWGGADKKGIERVVRSILGLDSSFKEHDDVFDALAIALVAGYSYSNPLTGFRE